MKSPDYLKNISNLELGNLIDQQEHIVNYCTDHAQKQIRSQGHEEDVHNPEGLYFANLRYQEMVSELRRRNKESRNSLTN